jgi:HEAT repeat protein
MLRLNHFRLASLLTPMVLVVLFLATSGVSQSNSVRSLTALQIEIEKQQNRLSSTEIEERREALTRLGALHHPEASRAAVAALRDASAIVRITAAAAVLSLPPEEGAAALLPLLNDKDEFVRQETAYALGKTRSRFATAPLIELFGREKKDSARGAIVVALGEISDEAAVVTLAQVLRPEMSAPNSKKRSKKKENLLVLRAAAHSLGQIGNRAAVPALVATLQDEQAESDVRRESAIALGLIGDTTALPALNVVTNAEDPYLARAAFDASRRIAHVNAP